MNKKILKYSYVIVCLLLITGIGYSIYQLHAMANTPINLNNYEKIVADSCNKTIRDFETSHEETANLTIDDGIYKIANENIPVVLNDSVVYLPNTINDLAVDYTSNEVIWSENNYSFIVYLDNSIYTNDTISIWEGESSKLYAMNLDENKAVKIYALSVNESEFDLDTYVANIMQSIKKFDGSYNLTVENGFTIDGKLVSKLTEDVIVIGENDLIISIDSFKHDASLYKGEVINNDEMIFKYKKDLEIDGYISCLLYKDEISNIRFTTNNIDNLDNIHQ